MQKTSLSFCRAMRTTLFIVMAVFLLSRPQSIAAAEKPVSIPEEIEWTWEVRPPHPDAKLPNVLLVGDSITRNYFPRVSKDLEGMANVYLFASSTCVGDPRLSRQLVEFAAMEHVSFQLVHFNNGMHGWGYTEEQYRVAFPGLIHSVRSLAGHNGTLIWANTTPVRSDANNGATNPRIDARNDIALKFIQEAGIILDDQHKLMMDHSDLYEDSIHFKTAGAEIQGDQAAATIKSALKR